MRFLEHKAAFFGVLLLSWPVYRTLARAFFGERFESLGEAIRYLLQPDIVSIFKGEYFRDYDATFRIVAYVALCLGWAAAVTELLARHVL